MEAALELRSQVKQHNLMLQTLLPLKNHARLLIVH